MFTFTLRNPEMRLDKKRTALVLADVQNEFLEEKPEGTYYALIADALKKRNVIANLDRLLKTAQDLGYFIIHSPHWYYPTDLQWSVPPGAIADYLVGIGFCGRKDPLDL
jgi:nicotinamidase-related amidase